jgi:hypothetical protein
MAADAKHDRHLMRQASYERCAFPIPIRWLHPGDVLTRAPFRYLRQSGSETELDARTPSLFYLSVEFYLDVVFHVTEPA